MTKKEVGALAGWRLCVFALMAMCIAFCLLATAIALQDWLKPLPA